MSYAKWGAVSMSRLASSTTGRRSSPEAGTVFRRRRTPAHRPLPTHPSASTSNLAPHIRSIHPSTLPHPSAAAHPPLPIRRHRRAHADRPLGVDVEGDQVSLVDADHGGPRTHGSVELGFIVDLDESIETELDRELGAIASKSQVDEELAQMKSELGSGEQQKELKS